MSAGSSFKLSLRSGLHWSGPHTSSSDIAITDVQAPASGGLTATVTALAPGRATLTASGAPICSPGQACPQFILLWTLGVVVTVAATPAPLVITTNESGRRFAARLGQEVVVHLRGGAIVRWTEPVARPTTKLRRVVGAGGNPASATFVAARRGVATVTSNESFTCSPRCQPPVMLFRVTIRVE